MSRNWHRPGNDIEGDDCEYEHDVTYVDDDTVECDDCGETFQSTEDEIVDYHQGVYENYRESIDDDRRHGI